MKITHNADTPTFRDAKKLHTTQAHKKLVHHFEALVRSDRFRSEILKLRRKLGIPAKGFNNDSAQEKWLIEYLGNDHTALSALLKEVDTICRKFNLDPKEWNEMIHPVIFFDDVLPLPLYKNKFALCRVAETHSMNTVELSEQFPISILVSPYASLRDILAYVQKVNPTEIMPLKRKYSKPEIKIGKFRKRKPLNVRRDDLIYQNRHLPGKEILRQLPTELKQKVDEGSVGKIVSKENLRRKQV
jgi:hypothetical protein